MWRPEVDIWHFPQLFFHLVFEIESLTGPPTDFDKASWSRAPLVSASPVLRLQMSAAVPGVLLGAEDLNAFLPDCMVNTLPTEPSTQLLQMHF